MSTLSQMGIPGVGSGMLMPKLKNKWRVTFLNVGSGGAGNSVDLSMQAINVTRPNLTFEEVPLHRYNSTAYVAGKYTWEPTTLTVEDDITGTASQVIQDQLEKQQKLIGADGPYLASASTASTYKFGTKIELLDGDVKVVERWILEGCWIMTTDFGDLDYSASDAATINLTMRFDHARQTIEKQGLGTAIGGAV